MDWNLSIQMYGKKKKTNISIRAVASFVNATALMCGRIPFQLLLAVEIFFIDDVYMSI